MNHFSWLISGTRRRS